MDWTGCELVEIIPGKVSGAALLRGTRLPADTVLSNYEAGSPVEEIVENFDTSERIVVDLLRFARERQKEL